MAGLREHVQQLVAVDGPAEVVDHDHPVAVAVERKAHLGAHTRDRQLQQSGASSRSRR